MPWRKKIKKKKEKSFFELKSRGFSDVAFDSTEGLRLALRIGPEQDFVRPGVHIGVEVATNHSILQLLALPHEK